MQKIPLPTGWTAKAVSNQTEVPDSIWNRPIAAEVPGCIHFDLMREELIPDPYLGENEPLVQWIGRTDWKFATTFTLSEEALAEERWCARGWIPSRRCG